MQPAATVMITTKNRRDELRAAIASALRQSAPVEVLVLDDGSNDGTADMVAAEFPTVRLVRKTTSAGLIQRRNELAALASSQIVISIDDDAAFSTPEVIAQTLKDFDHPRIGGVAIPFVNVKLDKTIHQQAPDAKETWVTHAYIGTAHALRKDIFLKLGGYKSYLVHQGEEPDFCIRLLAAGYVVRLGRADPIHHYESPRRDFRRMDYYGRRNDILFCCQNVPFPELCVNLPATMMNGLCTAARVGRYRLMLAGMAAAVPNAIRHWEDRRSVHRALYWLYRNLKKNGPAPLSTIEPTLAQVGL